MARTVVGTEKEKIKKLQEQIKISDAKIAEAIKNDLLTMQIFLGKALIRKVKENPEYKLKIVALIDQYSTKEEEAFFQKLEDDDRFF